MPNCALLPNKDTSVSAVRLAQLEGLGYGPDLQGENLVDHLSQADNQNSIDGPPSKSSALKPHEQRREWTGQFNDISRNLYMSLLAEGREPEVD